VSLTGDNRAVPTPPPLPPDRPDLAARYGVGRPRTRVPLGLAVIGAALLGLLAVVAWSLSQRETGVRAGVLSYGDITPTSITIEVEVVRPLGTAVRCDVAAVGVGQVDVGAAVIDVPADGEARVVASTQIPTASAPKGARLIGCRPAS
jgi:hypothetical protein